MTLIDIGEVPDLNEQQIEVIIAEALSAGFFELGQQGQRPQGVALKEAAVELVRQCRLAHRAGNRNPAITSILFAAEVDTRPLSSTQGAQPVSEDITTYTPELLFKLEETLMGYAPSEEVEQNLELIRGEIQRRGMTPKGENGGAPAAPAESVQETAPAPASDSAARKKLEDRLTFPMMRTHGIDPSDIPSLTDLQLQWIVDHPGGAPVEAPVPAPPTPEPKGETIETTRMVVPPPAPPEPPPAPKSEARAAAEEISAERLALEEQVTGPMLKAYGRGRNDVASGAIGDNELAFMIANPDGKVTQEALLAARALDEGPAPVVVPAQTTPTIAEQIAAEKAKIQQEQAPAEIEASGFAPAAPAVVAEAVSTPQIQQISPTPPIQSKPLMKDLPPNPAQEIIDRENFPVPAEVTERVVLPFDLSKLSDAEIFSHHSRAHSIHSRATYVLGLWESQLRDEVKLRKGREVHVANNLPIKDGRVKYTDAQREAMVQADPEVVAHREQEHEIEKVVRQLRGLVENYAIDVAVCSRQLSRRDNEREGAK